jgi:hypothetical protein
LRSSTIIVGDGSPEKVQIAYALRVAALVGASPDLAQTAIRAPAERRKDRRDPRGRGSLACDHLASVSGQQAVNALGARPTPGTLASLAA